MSEVQQNKTYIRWFRKKRRRTVSLALMVVVCILILTSTPVLGESSPKMSVNGTGTAEDPYLLANIADLQKMNEEPDAYYVLKDDIDARNTAEWNAGAGFEPIGHEDFSQDGEKFTGVFDGREHLIKGLTIRRPNRKNMALFAESNGIIKNVHLSDVQIEGIQPATIVSKNIEGAVSSVSATGSVTTDDPIAGGLVGINGGRVNESWADVDVSGAEYYSGGLTGRSWYGGQISNSYSKGHVKGEQSSGGVIGANTEPGSIQRVYAVGSVSGDTTGGLAEENAGLIVDSYWNVETTGQRNSVGKGDEAGTGLTTEEMTGTDVYSSMDALVSDEAWTATDSYPILQREIEEISLSTEREMVIAGNETDATVSLSLIGDRTETATTVADYASKNPDIATISDGVVTAHQPGEVELSSTLASETGMTEIVVIATEGISAIDAEVGSTDVTAGDTVTVTGTFRNVDENATYHHADLLVDGDAVITENVTVDGNSDEPHTFEWTPENPGSYSLSIDGIDAGSVDVVPKSTTEQPAGDNTGENADGSSDGEAGDNAQSGQSGSNDGDSGELPVVPLAIGGAVVAAVGGGVLLGRRL